MEIQCSHHLYNLGFIKISRHFTSHIHYTIPCAIKALRQVQSICQISPKIVHFCELVAAHSFFRISVIHSKSKHFIKPFVKWVCSDPQSMYFRFWIVRRLCRLTWTNMKVSSFTSVQKLMLFLSNTSAFLYVFCWQSLFYCCRYLQCSLWMTAATD